MSRAIPMGMPATMHHKTTNKRGVVGGAAAGAVAAGLLHRQSLGNIAMGALIEGAEAQRERNYMLQHKSNLLNKASQDRHIGGYLMLWQDRDANAWRWTCSPKYDAVAVPVRNHSPFTYEELIAHARRQIDGNLTCYYYKVVICVVMLCVLSSVACCLTGWLASKPNVHRRLAADVSEPHLIEGVSFSSLPEHERTQPSGTTIALYACIGTAILLCLLWGMWAGANCLFYSPLRRIIANLNDKPFWKQRGVTISLTRPGRDCCCLTTTRHCVVFQYGRNGQHMV